MATGLPTLRFANKGQICRPSNSVDALKPSEHFVFIN